MMTLIHNNRPISNICSGVRTIFRLELIIFNKEGVWQDVSVWSSLFHIGVRGCKFHSLFVSIGDNSPLVSPPLRGEWSREEGQQELYDRVMCLISLDIHHARDWTALIWIVQGDILWHKNLYWNITSLFFLVKVTSIIGWDDIVCCH